MYESTYARLPWTLLLDVIEQAAVSGAVCWYKTELGETSDAVTWCKLVGQLAVVVESGVRLWRFAKIVNKREVTADTKR